MADKVTKPIPAPQEQSSQVFAKVALELLQQSRVPIVSPMMENAMAVRQWLTGIAEGKLAVVPAAQLSPPIGPPPSRGPAPGRRGRK